MLGLARPWASRSTVGTPSRTSRVKSDCSMLENFWNAMFLMTGGSWWWSPIIIQRLRRLWPSWGFCSSSGMKVSISRIWNETISVKVSRNKIKKPNNAALTEVTALKQDSVWLERLQGPKSVRLTLQRKESEPMDLLLRSQGAKTIFIMILPKPCSARRALTPFVSANWNHLNDQQLRSKTISRLKKTSQKI